MTPADKPRFVAVLNGLCAVKPGPTAKLTAEALDVWWLALEDWSLADFEAVAKRLLQTSEFMPNPYHFEQLRKAGQQTAGEAWTQVLAAVRAFNRYEPPSLGERIDRVVHALGGYGALAMTNSDAMGFREKRFAELWAEIGGAQEVRQALPHLTGNRLEGPLRAVPQVGGR